MLAKLYIYKQKKRRHKFYEDKIVKNKKFTISTATIPTKQFML